MHGRALRAAAHAPASCIVKGMTTMKRFLYWSGAAAFVAAASAASPVYAADYYFNAGYSGIQLGTISNPFATLGPANSLNLTAGDWLLLQGSFSAPTGGIVL